MAVCIAVTGIRAQFVLCGINHKTRSRVSYLTFFQTDDACVSWYSNKILWNFLHFYSCSSQMEGASEQSYLMLLMLVNLGCCLNSCHPCLHGERCLSSNILVMTTPASVGGRKVKLFSTVYVEGITI